MSEIDNKKKSEVRMDPIFWFDFSRITLIVASLIAAIGGVGVLHFGKINSTNQNVEIAKSKERASLANLNAAEAYERAEAAKLESEKANTEAIRANTRTKEMEVDVQQAKKETALAVKKTKEMEVEVQTARNETQKAKKETEKLKLDVQEANLKVEQAKIEREKLKQQTLLLEAQDVRLINQQRNIAVFHIELIISIATKTLPISGKSNSFGNIATTGLMAQLTLNNPDEIIEFLKDPETSSQQVSPNKLIGQVSYSPAALNSFLSKDIEILNRVNTFDVDVELIIDILTFHKKQNIDPDGSANYQLIFVINGKKFNAPILESSVKNIFEKRVLSFNIADLCKSIHNQYLEDIQGEEK